MSNIVELNLDDTLADFEVQDWIDNVFSVQYPYIQATIKKGCQGNCGDKYKEENEQLKQQLTKGRDILFEFVKIACETFSEGCPECDYCFLGEVKQKAEVFFKELAE